MVMKLECGSLCNGELATGCKHCIQGSKMVLLVTGKCGWGCFYCPVSFEKKGLDVIYANEARVYKDEEILAEAESIDASGTGITGGDPLCVMERTLHYIRLLKERFGPDHHIHLYTATIDPDKVRALVDAGLDEIRFHPPKEMWTRMSDTKLAEIAAFDDVDVGIEVPALVGCESELIELVEYANCVGIDFVNLNELEFSESNWDMMEKYGYEVLDDISSAVLGSRETAEKVLEACNTCNVHFCSSPFKDGVQLRRRLIRRAEHICTDYQEVTDDGTLIKGYIYGDADAICQALDEMGVPDDMYMAMDGKVEVAPWILEDIAEELEWKCYESEQYPTADGLEVERIPLN